MSGPWVKIFEFLYRWIKVIVLQIKKIVFQNVQKYSIDSELSKKLEDAPYCTIPYGCIEGVIYSAGVTLKSNYNSEKEGVMQHTSMVEHKSRRVQGIWYFIGVFFHLLIIIVIVQSYRFCHFLKLSFDERGKIQEFFIDTSSL